MAHVPHPAPRGPRPLAARGGPQLRLLVGDLARRHRPGRPRRRDVHLHPVRQPRRGRRRPDQETRLHPGTRRRPPPSRAQPDPAAVRRGDDQQLRGLPARPGLEDLGRSAGEEQLRLREGDLRRLPHQRARPAARRAARGQPAAHRLGQPRHRQHRPGLRRRTPAQRGERELPRPAVPFTRLARSLRVRSGVGQAAARWRGHGPGLQAGQHHPARRRPAFRAGLRQLLPGLGRRRQRDNPATRQPGTPSPTPCWPCPSTRNSSPASRPTPL